MCGSISSSVPGGHQRVQLTSALLPTRIAGARSQPLKRAGMRPALVVVGWAVGYLKFPEPSLVDPIFFPKQKRAGYRELGQGEHKEGARAFAVEATERKEGGRAKHKDLWLLSWSWFQIHSLLLTD